MRTLSHRRWIAGGFAAIGVAVATALLWPSGEESRTDKATFIARQIIPGSAGNGVADPSTNVVADFFRQKYSPEQRAEFQVSSSQPVAIFVRETGVRVHTDAGWQPFSQEPRNEIWRLRPGIKREMFLERPSRETGQAWRAYILYGAEIQGPKLWKWQILGVWKTHSFSNWTGQAW